MVALRFLHRRSRVQAMKRAFSKDVLAWHREDNSATLNENFTAVSQLDLQRNSQHAGFILWGCRC